MVKRQVKPHFHIQNCGLLAVQEEVFDSGKMAIRKNWLVLSGSLFTFSFQLFQHAVICLIASSEFWICEDVESMFRKMPVKCGPESLVTPLVVLVAFHSYADVGLAQCVCQFYIAAGVKVHVGLHLRQEVLEHLHSAFSDGNCRFRHPAADDFLDLIV